MHARAGTRDGVLNHTVSGQSWQNLWFNGTLGRRDGDQRRALRYVGLPGLLVTGDEAVCREARELLGDGLTTVAVKTGLGVVRRASVPGAAARELIEAGAKQALADLGAVGTVRSRSPVHDRGRVHDDGRVRRVRAEAGRRDGGERRIVSQADAWWEAWQQFFF